MSDDSDHFDEADQQSLYRLADDQCACCGRIFEPDLTGPGLMYCSDSCYQEDTGG